MRRVDMVCSGCIKFDGTNCRLNPVANPIGNPDAYWCAQGQWRAWSQRFLQMEPYFWGEWETEILH